jgi:ABC-2 type transport system permease protein
MSGMTTVARLELVLRYRAGRWRWLLVSWFLGLTVFSVLLELVVRRSHGYQSHEGTVLFGGLQLFMLGLALFIVPALTSQSVNGDREQGRLGVLQVTEVTASDIIGGKLLAAWGTACLFVLVSAPITVWAMVQGGITVWQVLVVSVVMMLLLGIICAVGLGLSAILSRSTTSSVLTYVAVFVLTVGTLVLAGLISAIDQPSGGSLTWQPLAPNPFVILADTAPAAPTKRFCFSVDGGGGALYAPGSTTTDPVTPSPQVICQTELVPGDVLGGIRESIRRTEGTNGYAFGPTPPGTPVWPYGLAFDLLVAGALLWAAVRRLRTPRRRVPNGVRLA